MRFVPGKLYKVKRDFYSIEEKFLQFLPRPRSTIKRKGEIVMFLENRDRMNVFLSGAQRIVGSTFDLDLSPDIYFEEAES